MINVVKLFYYNMKAIIIIVVLIIINTNNIIDARKIIPNNYMKNLNKSINKLCNNKALIITNNINVYNCLNNNINNCKNLNNYTEFYNIKSECIKDYESEFGKGIFISIILWLILSLITLR